MSAHQKISLKLIAGPGTDAIISAPPILNASDHTVDFTCGGCGTVLMHAKEGQIHSLTILCTICGAYNSTEL